jgi:hypothetical protein
MPAVVGVVKDYPLYRSIYEDTKYSYLNRCQIERLGFEANPDSQMKILPLEVPKSFLV